MSPPLVQEKVFSIVNGSILLPLSTTPITTASNSSQTVQFTAPVRGANPISVRVTEKPCQVCPYREPDCCQALSPNIQVSLLDARKTNFPFCKQEGYNRSPRNPAEPTSSRDSGQNKMAYLQGSPQSQAMTSNCSKNEGPLGPPVQRVDAEAPIAWKAYRTVPSCESLPGQYSFNFETAQSENETDSVPRDLSYAVHMDKETN